VTLTWKTRAVPVTGIVALLIGLGLVELSAWLPTPSLAAFSIGGAVVGACAGAIFKELRARS
jgi:hypothetical protein